jgi:hypothetical protein
LTASIGAADHDHLILLCSFPTWVSALPPRAQQPRGRNPRSWLRQALDFLDRFTERRWATGALAVWRCSGAVGRRCEPESGDLTPARRDGPTRATTATTPSSPRTTASRATSSPSWSRRGRRMPFLRTLTEIDRLAHLQQVPGVQRTTSWPRSALHVRRFRGATPWLTIADSQSIIRADQQRCVLNASAPARCR